jgi:predicted Zn finger-like uncharacterized protein
MNNACPSCGAVYAVAAKDIGRKIKCKKCGSALIVSDAGLVVDAPTASAPPPAAAVAVVAEVEDDFDSGDDDVITSKKGKKAKKTGGGGGPNFGAMLAKLGGIPTILFTIGVFLVIWFAFMPKIGEAAILRADGYKQKLEMEKLNKITALTKGKTAPKEEDMKKINEDYESKIQEASEDAVAIRLSNARSVWFDRYGTMFGFFFVAFGCIGYLRTEQHVVVRIVAGAILTLMMLVVFVSVGGCGGDHMPNLPSTKGGVGGF